MQIFDQAPKMNWEEIDFFVHIRDIYISKQMLKFARERIKKKVKLELEQIESSNTERKNTRIGKLVKKEEEVACNVRWPVCLDTIESSKERKRANSFFIYRASQLPVTIEHNHFARKTKKIVGDKSRESRTPERQRVTKSFSELGIDFSNLLRCPK